MMPAPDAPGFDLSAFAAQRPPRAGGFIVTLYGDAVLPRGGELAMSAIVETCAQVGISETLVRTAVSRLVAAGQLEGHRQGRRSFYRLTPAAAAAFAAAARTIYAPPAPCGWRLVAGPEAALAGLEGAGFVRLRAGLMLGPDRGPLPAGCAAVAGPATGQTTALAEMAAQLWDLGAQAGAYAAFAARFAPVLPQAALLPAHEALAVRLLAVDVWRRAALADPGLPMAALPPEWPGPEARALFARLYGALSPAAEGWIGSGFDAATGRLAAVTPDSRARLALLDMSQENMNPVLIRDALVAIP
jgi:phenylacetic acid degradation operon negative regulatory protein